MSEHHPLDEGMRWRIVGRLEVGQSQALVARELDLIPSVISNLFSQFKTSGTECRRPRQGCPRATTANEDRYLFLLVKRQRTATTTQLSKDFAVATEYHFQIRQFPGHSMKEGCMPGILLFASHSLPQKSACRMVQTTSELDTTSMG